MMVYIKWHVNLNYFSLFVLYYNYVYVLSNVT